MTFTIFCRKGHNFIPNNQDGLFRRRGSGVLVEDDEGADDAGDPTA